MARYRVNFRKELASGQLGDRREYGIIVDAENLGQAEINATREITSTHSKGFLSANDIIKIEQVA